MIDSAPYDPENDELVAYLDDELDAEEVERIESRLASDPEYRTKLQRLKRAWDLLDDLPRAEATHEFTHSTITMVAAQAEQTHTRSGKLAKWWNGVGLLMVSLAGLAAFFVVWLRAGAEDRRFLGKLSVVQNLEVYRHIDSVDFARQLADKELFSNMRTQPLDSGNPTASRDREQPASGETNTGETGATGELDLDDVSMTSFRLVPGDYWQRKEYVKSLSPAKQSVLKERWERFQRESPGEQQRMLTLDASLAADPERESLYAAISAYHQWRQSLSQIRRAEIDSQEDRERRLIAINKELARQERERFSEECKQTLTAEDFSAVRSFVYALLAKHEEELLALLPSEERLLPSDPDRRGMTLLFKLARYRQLWVRDVAEKLTITNDDLDQLKVKLSRKAQDHLSQTPAEERKALVFRWMEAFIRAQFPFTRISAEQLQEYYEKLPKREKERLAEMQEDQRREQLRWMMMRQGRGGFGRPSGGPGVFRRPGTGAAGPGAGPGPRNFPERRPPENRSRDKSTSDRSASDKAASDRSASDKAASD